MEKELPKNWIEISFTDIFDINGGTQPPKAVFINEPKDGYIRLLQIRDFGSKPVPTYIPDTGKLMTCKKDDILIARYGASIGRIVTGMQGSYNVALAKVSIPERMNKNFVKWLLKSNLFQEPILSIQRTAQNGFNKTDLATILVPLPPLTEQNRIVAKLDSLFAQLENIKTSTAKIPFLLKNFRQQVLTQAVTGKLTEEWREGKKLPEWKNSILLEVITEKPRNGFSPKAVEYETAVKSLTLSATTSGKFNPLQIKYLDIQPPDINSHLWLKKNDILIQRSNSLDYVGTAAIYDGSDFDFIYPDIMMKIRANNKILNEYLFYSLSSKTVKEYYKNNASGTAGNMPKINQEIVSNTPIKLPSILEQQEIVSRVESLFAKADAIEEKYKNLKAKIETLPQTILHKAFKGELTEQLETDGYAKVLLAEIAALKNGEKPKKVVAKKYVQPDDEVLRIVAEPAAVGYHTKVEKTPDWYDQRFELWVSQQGLAARGTLDKATLREIFDAMDDEDK